MTNYQLFVKCANYLSELKSNRGLKSTKYWSNLLKFDTLKLFFKPILFFKKRETVVLTYSTFKRHIKDEKYLDPIVHHVKNYVDEDALIIEKNQRFLRFLPSYHPSTEFNVGVSLLVKAFSVVVTKPIEIMVKFNNIRNKTTTSTKYLRIYVETHVLAAYFMLLIMFVRPKSVFFASQFSIESMALCVASRMFGIKCTEVQHGNIISTSPIYDFSLSDCNPRFFADSFLVKNDVVKRVLLEKGRITDPSRITVMEAKTKADKDSNTLLVCLGLTDLPKNAFLHADSEQYDSVILRPHPGFKDLDVGKFENVSRLLKKNNVRLSKDTPIEADFAVSSDILCGISTVIIDGYSSGHKVYTWDSRAIEFYKEYNHVLSL